MLARLRDVHRVDVQPGHRAGWADLLGEQLEDTARSTRELEYPPARLNVDALEQRDGVLVQFVGLAAQAVAFGGVASDRVDRWRGSG